MADTPAFIPIEEKHGDDCTCPAAGRIVIELVAASRTCPGDRNPHRAARTAAGDSTPHWAPLWPHGLDAEMHNFPQRYPYTGEYDPCACGLRFGETASEARRRLGADTHPDLAAYHVDRTLGGTTLLRHAVDDCDTDEAVDVDDDSLSTLVDIATRHHAEHHGAHATGNTTIQEDRP